MTDSSFLCSEFSGWDFSIFPYRSFPPPYVAKSTNEPQPNIKSASNTASQSGFLDIPADIRLLIYQYLVPTLEVSAITKSPLRHDNEPCCTSILRVNRQIYQEAIHEWYGFCTYNIELQDKGVWFLGSHLTSLHGSRGINDPFYIPPIIKQVAFLCIRITASHYQYYAWHNRRTAKFFQGFENIQRLDIQMQINHRLVCRGFYRTDSFQPCWISKHMSGILSCLRLLAVPTLRILPPLLNRSHSEADIRRCQNLDFEERVGRASEISDRYLLNLEVMLKGNWNIRTASNARQDAVRM